MRENKGGNGETKEKYIKKKKSRVTARKKTWEYSVIKRVDLVSLWKAYIYKK